LTFYYSFFEKKIAHILSNVMHLPNHRRPSPLW